MTLDTLFNREFKELMNALAYQCTQPSLEKFPVPFEFSQVGTNAIYVQDISEPYYDKLNGSYCLLNKDELKRRKYDYLGEFMQNEDGSLIYEDVKVPQGSVAIISQTNIAIPYEDMEKSSDGFEYVDFLEKNGNSFYIYIVPKENCYRCNRTSLVLSWSRQSKFYSGLKIATCMGKYMFMQVIPRSVDKDYQTFRVICSKYSVDYSKEIHQLSEYWVQNKIVFDKDKCAFEDPTSYTVDNLAVQELDPTLSDYAVYDNYPMTQPKQSIDGDNIDIDTLVEVTEDNTKKE